MHIAIGVVSKGFPSVRTGPRVHVFRAADVRDLNSILERFQDAFGEDLSGVRCLCGGMKIHLKEGPIVPRNVKGARHPPQACQQVCKEYLEMLVKTDVIVPQEESTEWCTGAHFVDKANGKVRTYEVDIIYYHDYMPLHTSYCSELEY